MADSRREDAKGLRQPIFLGGVHDFLPADLIPEASARLLENADILQTGVIRRRGGTLDHSSLGSGHTGSVLLLKKFQEEFHDDALVALYQTSPTAATLSVVDGSGDSIDIPMTFVPDFRTNVVKMLNRVYVLNGQEVPRYWQYGNSTLLFERGTPTGMPISTTALVFQGRAYAGQKDLLYFSLALGNAQVGSAQFTWDQQFQAFRVDTGNIVELFPFRSNILLILTDGGIVAFEPNPCDILESTLSVLSRSVGCVNRNTCQSAGEDMIFMDQVGHIRSLAQTELDETKGVTNAPLSLVISNVIARQNKEYLHTCRSEVRDGIYWIWMPMDGAQNPTEGWGYSLRDKSWFGPVKLQKDWESGTLSHGRLGGLCTLKYQTQPERLYALTRTEAGATKIQRLFEVSSLSDSDTLIPLKVETRSFNPQPERRKEWNHLEVEFRMGLCMGDEPTDLKVEVRSDEAGWQSLGTFELEPNAGTFFGEEMPFDLEPESRQHLKIPLTGVTKSYGLQVRLTVRDDTNGFELLGVLLTFQLDNIDYAV